MSTFDPFFGRRLTGPLSHLKPTKENQQALQLSAYRYILETHYGMPIAETKLVVFNSTRNDCFEVTPTPYFRDEAEALIGKTEKLSKEHREDLDAAVTFTEATQTYSVIGEGTKKRVTGLIASHFPPFNPNAAVKAMRAGKKWNAKHAMWGKSDAVIKELWKQAGQEASRKGKALHKAIEAYYTRQEIPNKPPIGYKGFLKFIGSPEYVGADYFTARVERPIYCNGVAGTPDIVITRGSDGAHEIIDWKYNNKDANPKNFGRLEEPPSSE